VKKNVKVTIEDGMISVTLQMGMVWSLLMMAAMIYPHPFLQ
jgi:hypothetical protein